MNKKELLALILGCDFSRKDVKILINQILFLTGCIIVASLLS
jgi:hypothetical protein